MWKEAEYTKMMTREVHAVALIYSKISQDTWITEQEWERREITLKFYLFQERQKLKSSSLTSTQNSAISGPASLAAFGTAHCPSVARQGLYCITCSSCFCSLPADCILGILISLCGEINHIQAVLSNEGYVFSREFQKSKQWHVQLQNSTALPDEIQRLIGSVFSFLGTLFCSSDYRDKCNKSRNKWI